MNDPDHLEFQKLLQQAIDDDITKEEAHRLQELAKNHPERIKEMVDHFQIISVIQDGGDVQSLGDLVDFYSPNEGPTPEVTGKVITFPVVYKAIAVVALVMASCLVWLFKETEQAVPQTQHGQVVATSELPKKSFYLKDHYTDTVAQILHDVGAKWVGDNQPGKGTALGPGLYELSKGIAEVEFFSGAKVVVEGPAKLELLTPYDARIFHGKIRAYVPEQAQGFSIQTSNFELIDLGTEFGLEMSPSGEADVQVFEGEVEIHSPHQEKKSIVTGQAYTFDRVGVSSVASISPETYPSFADVQKKSMLDSYRKLVEWKQWNESMKKDPHIVRHYDFENKSIPHGSIVGCEWTEGRWPGKGALEFRRIGDRIRVNIPGEYEELTLISWIRLSSLPYRHQALLLTDLHEQDRIHWQISIGGELCLGTKSAPGERDKWRKGDSPILYKPEDLGVWSLICTTFNINKGTVKHYYNGKLVKEFKENYLRPIKIGAGDIGNWSVPTEGPTGPRALRNFVGRIDQLSILNRALSDLEVENIYSRYRP